MVMRPSWENQIYSFNIIHNVRFRPKADMRPNELSC